MTANNVAICLRELGASVPAPAQPAAEATEAPVVALKGLVGAAQHNGQRASVLNFAADRFTVQLEADGTQLSVKPANIEVAVVPVGLAVGVGGLVGAAEHNGKRGAVASGPDLTTGRYSVKLEEGGKPLGLKPANLRLLEGMAADEPSQGPGPPPELEPEPEPEPELEPKPEALEFAGLAWPTGEPSGRWPPSSPARPAAKPACLSTPRRSRGSARQSWRRTGRWRRPGCGRFFTANGSASGRRVS